MRRIFILGVVIYFLFVLALARTNGTLLALMLPVLVYLGIGFFFSPNALNLEINRALSTDRAHPGDEILIQVNITNRGSNLELLEIQDHIPDGLKIIDGNNYLLTSLSPGENTSLSYSVSGPRGFFHFRWIDIYVSDNLLVRTQTKQIQTNERLFIQPKPLHLGHLEIRPRRTRVYAGYIPAKTGGSGVEFFGVREYQPGDPLRWVNWRASARHRLKFFINEFEQERVADIGIILDTRQSSQIVTKNGESLFEFSVQAASALAISFLTEGNRVGLLMYGTLLDWTLPDYGKFQSERILKRLSMAQPGESLVFADLEHLPTRLLPPKSQIVFISPLNDRDLPVLVGLRACGYAVMVVSPNPILFEKSNLSIINEDTQMAARLAELERLVMLKKLRQAGIQVLDWQTSVPLDQALLISMSHPTPMISISV